MSRANKPAGFSIRVKANEAEILIYEEIDANYGIGAKAFREELKAAGDVSQIRVRINSVGGSVFEGLAIYNTLKGHPAHKIVMVDGVALSMASVVAMAGDEIEMAENSWLMIHNPLGVAVGDGEEMHSMADLLDRMKAQLINIYQTRSKRTAEEISAWMDSEAWMTSEEAIDRGFADRSTKALAVAAAFDTSRFSNTPNCFRGEIKMAELPTLPITPPSAPATPLAPLAASYADLKAGCPGADAPFLCSQMERTATLDQARAAWMEEQTRRLTAVQSELVQAQAKAAKPAPVIPGVAPLGTAGGKPAPEGDAIDHWNELVDGYAKSCGSRGKAISRAVREHPEAHREMLVAYNAAHKRPCN